MKKFLLLLSLVSLNIVLAPTDTQYSQESTNCSICLGDIKSEDQAETKCGHKFHKDCIKEWLGKGTMGKNCPLCRQSIHKDFYQKIGMDPTLPMIQKGSEGFYLEYPLDVNLDGDDLIEYPQTEGDAWSTQKYMHIHKGNKKLLIVDPEKETVSYLVNTITPKGALDLSSLGLYGGLEEKDLKTLHEAMPQKDKDRIKYLRLNNNNLRRLDPSFFEEYRNLEAIDLSNNPLLLDDLQANVFGSAPLKEICISNIFPDHPLDFFKQYTDLKKLVVSPTTYEFAKKELEMIRDDLNSGLEVDKLQSIDPLMSVDDAKKLVHRALRGLKKTNN